MMYDELNAMSERELKDIEDTLLLEREMGPQMRIRHTGGRFVLFVLSCAIWLLLTMVIASRLTASLVKTQFHGVFSIVGFFVSLGLSIYLSQLIWRKAGVETRFLIRNAVHYWPVTMYFITGIYIFLKG